MRRRSAFWLLSLLLCVPAVVTPAFALPAFPGAEGYGSTTVGGRGGIIVEVTNLNDSGLGSLRYACENYTEPRIVVFRVGGTIVLTSGDIEIREGNSYLTIAGQTAPGDGVQLKGAGILIMDGAHDIVLRYLRIRPGESAPEDCVTIWGNNGTDTYRRVYNVVVDHCSLQWAPDENTNVWDYCDGVTFQWCIIAEGTGQNKGFISGYGSGSGTPAFDIEVGLHHNLFAHNEGRNPYFKQGRDGPADFRNNVVYNWLNNNVGQVEVGQQASFVANYYKEGPDTNWGGIILVPDGTNATGIQIFVDGNRGQFCPSGCSNQWDIGIAYYQGGHITAPEDKYRMWSPYFPPTVTTHTASEAWDLVLAGAGATKPSRDAVDTRIVNEVTNGTGECGKSSDWPNLQSGTPPTDSDHDAMPDSWETAHGLNPNNASDRNGDLDGDGYTNIEEYLNETEPGGGQPPVANFTGNPTTGTAPLAVNFTDTSTNSPTSWDWTFGDGGTSEAEHPSHEYTTADTYTVSLDACNAQGCDNDTKQDYITVTSGGTVYKYAASYNTWCGSTVSGTISNVQSSDNSYLQVRSTTSGTRYGGWPFTIDTGYTPSQVSNIQVEIEWHSSSASTPDYYIWLAKVGGGEDNIRNGGTWTTSDQWFTWQTSAVSTYMTSGGAIVVDFGGCYGSTTWNAYIDAVRVKLTLVGGSAPVASFSGSPTSGTAPLTVNFTDSSTNSPTAWSWTFGDSSTSTAQNPSHQYTSANSYTVSLQATNASGSDTETKTDYITVDAYAYPTARTAWCGSLVSGGLSDVQTSNDAYFRWRCAGDEHGGNEWTIDTDYTPSQLSKLTVELEMKTSLSDTPDLWVYIYKVSASDWETLRSGPTWSTSDECYTWSTTSVSDYMTSEGVVTLGIGGCPNNGNTWDLYHDVIRLKLEAS